MGNSGGKARCASEGGWDLLRFELCMFSGAGNTLMCISPFPWSFFFASCFPSSPALKGQNLVWEVEQEVNSCPLDRNSLFSCHVCPHSLVIPQNLHPTSSPAQGQHGPALGWWGNHHLWLCILPRDKWNSSMFSLWAKLCFPWGKSHISPGSSGEILQNPAKPARQPLQDVGFALPRKN